MNPFCLFIHGLDSSSRGTKGAFFRENHPVVQAADFVGSFSEKMSHLNQLLTGRDACILIGSSYGGLMATVFACGEADRLKRLILLAPALTLPELKPYRTCRLSIPTILYHGRFDDVVPPDAVRKIAGAMFSHLDYHLVDDDHNLHDTFRQLDWPKLLDLSPARLP